MPLALLHLAHRTASHRPSLGVIARRPGRQHERDVSGQIVGGRVEPSHRAKRSVRQRRLPDPALAVAAISVRDAVGRHIAGIPDRGPHAERRQDARADVVAKGHARHVGDNAAQQREAVVRVLEGRARRGRKRQPLFQPVAQRLVWDGELTIAPGVVFGKSLGVCEQVPDRDGRRVPGRQRDTGKLRDVPGHRVVERQLALVAQREDGQRGEALGHRRDAEDRLRRRGLVRLHVTHAHRARGRQLAVDDHAPRQSRCADLLGRFGHAVADCREGAGQLLAARPIGEDRHRATRRFSGACV